MKTQLGPTKVAFAGILLIALLSGCETTNSKRSEQSTDYAWARQLGEQVELVPELQENAEAPLATPTVDAYTKSAWPWGTPQDLTKPTVLQSGSQTQQSAVKTSPKQDTQPGQAPVIVQVNQGGMTSEPAQTETITSQTSSSTLENLYGGNFERAASRELEQFGYTFLRQLDKTEDSTGPVPGNYILGPGDEISITLSGGVEAYHRLTIDRDGILSIPEFGTLAIAGKRYDSLQKTLMTFLEERRRGFELTVSLGKLRKIQVHVVGKVASPGTIEIPAMATPLVALAKAGGATKDGSLRSIRLNRILKTGFEDKSIDLYHYLIQPDELNEPELMRDGDTLIVPPIGKTFGVAGYVQQPGIYEITDDQTTIQDALQLAGGLTPFSFTPLAQLERTVDGRGRQKVDIELNEEGLSATMLDGELLLIEAVDDSRQPVVRIEGEVARPGDYQFRPGMTLSDLVNNADGLTINAYLPQLIISRQLGKANHVEAITDRTGHQQTRRILVANLEKALAKDPAHDIELMPLDLVTIQSQMTAQERAEVEIIGSVQRPGKYELTAAMRVSDLVAIARNPSPDAYYDQAELIRRVFDETTRRLDVQRYRFNLRDALNPQHAYSAEKNPVLKNGDRLVVRSLQQAQVRVRIEGQVQFPGEYIFPSGAKITDLIAAAGGLLADADLRAASFIRQSTRRLQQEKLNHLNERTRRLYETSLERMVQTGSPQEGLAAKIALEQTQNTLERMRSLEADGRIVIPFATPTFPESPYNLVLENNDSLTIPQKHSTISVSGHVFRPISLVAFQPLTVEEALNEAGGLTETADEDLIYVIRADGSVDSVAQKPARLNKQTHLLAGDVLLVPRKPLERTLGAQLSDMLYLARQTAEAALIASQVGNDVDMTLVSPSSQNQLGVNADLLMGQLK